MRKLVSFLGGGRNLGAGIPHLSRYDLRPLLKPTHERDVTCSSDEKVLAEERAKPARYSVESMRLKRGWYMAEILLESEQSFLDASFSLTRPGGRKPLQLRLPARSGRIAKRLIWCARGGERLAFSPSGCWGACKILKLNLVRVSGLFARDRMKVRLSRRQLAVPRPTTDRWVRYDATFSPNGARVSYHEWIRNIEPKLLRSDRALRTINVQFSLLMPVGENDCRENVQRTLDSIRHQSCKHWRVTMILAEPPDMDYRAELVELAAGDNRIHTVGTADWEEMLARQGGEYHLVCSPGVILSSAALSSLGHAVKKRPEGKVFYSDEDLLNESGRRSAPRFKPAWNPDLFFSRNYIGNCVLFAPGILVSAGKFLFGGEPAWDFSLILGALRNLDEPETEIVHVPRILVHRSSEVEDPGYLESCGRLLERHFAELGQEEVQVNASREHRVLRVSWPVQKQEPFVSLLIPTRDMLSVLKLCVESILEKTSYKNYEILILDNQSCEPETRAYFSYLESLPNVRVLPYDAPFNYSAINNFGARHARGEILGLINNDVEVINPDWLREMVGHASRPEIGCVGAKLYYGDGRIQHAGVVVGLGGLAGHVHKFHSRDSSGYMNRLFCTQRFSSVTAACLLVRKSVFEAVGGLNEEDLSVAFNDVDLCLKVVRSGYRNVWTPWAELYHHESISRGMDNTREKRQRFEREAKYLKDSWVKNFGLDPYYSPFLTYSREDFSLGLNEKRTVPLVR